MAKRSSFRCFALTFAFATISNFASADSPVMPDISTGWRFQTGDNSKWSQPSLDDSQWRSINVGTPWDEQGLADYDGYAWYRLHVTLSSEGREDPDFKLHQALKITLGKIDDVDRTWFNGKEIGSTGGFPDAYSAAWQTTRSYLIPASLIRWDEENVVAVRVYDGDRLGGMAEGPYQLELATWSDFVKVEFDLGRGFGIFVDQQRLPIAATIRNDSDVQVSGELRWTVKDDEGKNLSTESAAAVVPARSYLRATCPSAPEVPGFYHVTCALHANESDTIKSESKMLGFKPEEVTSSLTREPDFDEFWRETLRTLATVSPEFKTTHHPDRDSETHEVHEVQMRSLGGVQVRGWYEKPKAAGSHPALLRVPGYSSNMQPTGTGDPLAVFSFNIRAHGNSQDDVSGTPEDYWIRGLDDKQGYFYQGAYADCVRAVDFLASRQEVDATRIAVTGGSQGGGLSLVSAALDPRISLCAPDIPFLCDWVRYFRATQWPEIDKWIEDEPHRSWEKTLRTMSYFDALNFTQRIKCPVFLGAGLQDDVCPPATIFSVYNRLNVPKEYRVYPHAGHWVDAPHNNLRRQWILDHFSKEE